MSETKRESLFKRNQKVRVLLLEDDPDHAAVISKAVKDVFGLAPLTATNRESALVLLEKCQAELLDQPVLILLDLYFPDRATGMDLLSTIKEHPPKGRLPVIVFSGSGDGQDIQDAYERGANCYLIKPMLFENWQETFRALEEYWREVATLPFQQLPPLL